MSASGGQADIVMRRGKANLSWRGTTQVRPQYDLIRLGLILTLQHRRQQIGRSHHRKDFQSGKSRHGTLKPRISAIAPKADIKLTTLHVRFVPLTDISSVCTARIPGRCTPA
jgi:hypothetical protein